MPVRQAEDPLSYRQPRRAIAEFGDHSSELVSGDRWRPVAVGTIGPGRGPLELSRDPTRRMNPNDDVVDRRQRVRALGQRHTGQTRSRIRRHDCLHLGHLLSVPDLAWPSMPDSGCRIDNYVTSTVCNVGNNGKCV